MPHRAVQIVGRGRLAHLRVKARWVVRGGAGKHERPHQARTLDGDLQGDAAAQAVADEIDNVDAELPEQRSSILCHLLVGQRAVDISSVAMSWSSTAMTFRFAFEAGRSTWRADSGVRIRL